MSQTAFNDPVDGALWMHERGFKLFPVIARGKIPAVENWQEWADKADERNILGYATDHPGTNWGIHLGASGHVVIDIDDGWKDSGGSLVKRNGAASFKSVLDTAGKKLEKTLVVRSPSGGLHLYFKGDGRNSANALGTHIDTRGAGGYVLAPGSVGTAHSGPDDPGSTARYVIDKSEPVAPLPKWIADQLSEKKKEAAVIKEAVKEGSRNHTLASIAGTLRARGMGYEVILAALTALNQTQFVTPLSAEEVETTARSISKYEPASAKVAADFIAAPESELTIRALSSIDPAKIPKRDWILKNCYLGKFITLIVSPGGVGKSTISLLDGLSVASGMNLSGYDVVKPGPVMIYNAEDPLDELERRAVAMAAYHNLPLATLNNIYLVSGRERPFIYARNNENRETIINEQEIARTTKLIQDRGIRLFIADPFVRTHLVNENDNMAIDKVAQAFQRIATNTGCAVCLIHHTNKGAATAEDTSSANLSRGASALVNAARVAQTLTPMRDLNEAIRAGVTDGRWKMYFRRENAKANLSAPSEFADWYRRDEIEIANGELIGVCTVADLRARVDAKLAALDLITLTTAREMEPGQVKSFQSLHPHKIANMRAKPDVTRALSMHPEFETGFDFMRRRTPQEIAEVSAETARADFFAGS